MSTSPPNGPPTEPGEPPLPPEPFPWMSTNKPSGPFRFVVRTPRQAAFWGVFLVVAGVAFLLETIGKQEVGVIVVGVLIFVTLSGVGVTALVIARARARWARAYRERHGWSPF